jgi:phosphoribosylamine--glycine ligase
MPIFGLGHDGQLEDSIDGVMVFHAGTSRPDVEGPFLVNGGRVLTVSATAETLKDARALAYKAVAQISFEGMQYRTDIAEDAVRREEQS